MDAGSGRLERAADRIYLILGIYRDKMPNEAVEALQGVAAALGAAKEPAPPQACGDNDPACTCAALPKYPCIKHAPEPAQAVEAVARAAAIQAVVLCYERSRTGAPILCDAPEIVEAAAAHALRTHQNGGA